MRYAPGFLFGILVWGLSIAHAADLIRLTDGSGVAGEIRALGYQSQLVTGSDGDPVVRSRVGQTRYVIFFYGCRQNRNCQSIQFTTAYDTDGITLSRINRWNSQKRYINAWLDDDDDVQISMELYVGEGITRDYFERALHRWHYLVGEFEDHINW